MPGASARLLASLLLAAALSATPGLGSPVKEKRGWTLNSAGYLLGPHAIDNHRSFHDKLGLAGKRELPPEDDARPGSLDRPLPESDERTVRTIMEFLTFLHLKEAGALVPVLPAAVSSEDAERAAPREPGRFMTSHEAPL
ncbi:galanin peptides [Pteronotus mesoamericanus]|uniref:galanin peptides n=1 Tax=Pteronotus mesoamericanus TaxID=1884717 RepID=UPI0023EBF8FE|nr:galanin peptides [Pteronotus parnellii mesoamericanus]